MPTKTGAIFALSLAGSALISDGATHAADEARLLAFGKHLAQQCTGCHRIDGANTGIPAIIGWPADQFVAVLGAYKTGDRPNPAMVSIAQTLGDDEMTALAAYFGALKPAAPVKRK